MKKWQSVLVAAETPIVEAIKVLDKGALRIALIVDDEQKLIGTLTDGDIRRALISHVSMEQPVARIMCSTPRVAKSGWSRKRTLSLMESADLLQLPIVDNQDRVVGLETLHSLLEKRVVDNPVFLMAGGFGTRLKPLTNACPKPMLKIGEKPILELILESFIEAGFHRFFISTHYLPQMIRDYFGDGSHWGISIQYIHEEQPLGTGGALGLLPLDEIDQPMIMMNGDLLTTPNYLGLLDFHKEQGCTATMCVREFEYKIPYGVIQSDGTHVQSMVEKPSHKCFINAGMYVVSPELVKTVKAGARIDMPSVLESAIAQGHKVAMFPLHEYWLDVGQMNDFREAQDVVKGLWND